MKLRTDLERAIYAAAYVAAFDREWAKGMPPMFREGRTQTEALVEWQEMCAETGVSHALALVALHRRVT